MFDGLIQPWHLLIVLLIVLIIFGPGKLSGVGGALGKTIRDFRTSVNEEPTQPNQPTETVIKTPPVSNNTTTTTVVTSEPNANNTHVRS